MRGSLLSSIDASLSASSARGQAGSGDLVEGVSATDDDGDEATSLLGAKFKLLHSARFDIIRVACCGLHGDSPASEVNHTYRAAELIPQLQLAPYYHSMAPPLVANLRQLSALLVKLTGPPWLPDPSPLGTGAPPSLSSPLSGALQRHFGVSSSTGTDGSQTLQVTRRHVSCVLTIVHQLQHLVPAVEAAASVVVDELARLLAATIYEAHLPYAMACASTFATVFVQDAYSIATAAAGDLRLRVSLVKDGEDVAGKDHTVDDVDGDEGADGNVDEEDDGESVDAEGYNPGQLESIDFVRNFYVFLASKLLDLICACLSACYRYGAGTESAGAARGLVLSLTGHAPSFLRLFVNYEKEWARAQAHMLSTWQLSPENLGFGLRFESHTSRLPPSSKLMSLLKLHCVLAQKPHWSGSDTGDGLAVSLSDLIATLRLQAYTSATSSDVAAGNAANDEGAAAPPFRSSCLLPVLLRFRRHYLSCTSLPSLIASPPNYASLYALYVGTAAEWGRVLSLPEASEFVLERTGDLFRLLQHTSSALRSLTALKGIAERAPLALPAVSSRFRQLRTTQRLLGADTAAELGASEAVMGALLLGPLERLCSSLATAKPRGWQERIEAASSLAAAALEHAFPPLALLPSAQLQFTADAAAGCTLHRFYGVIGRLSKAVSSTIRDPCPPRSLNSLCNIVMLPFTVLAEGPDAGLSSAEAASCRSAAAALLASQYCDSLTDLATAAVQRCAEAAPDIPSDTHSSNKKLCRLLLLYVWVLSATDVDEAVGRRASPGISQLAQFHEWVAHRYPAVAKDAGPVA